MVTDKFLSLKKTGTSRGSDHNRANNYAGNKGSGPRSKKKGVESRRNPRLEKVMKILGRTVRQAQTVEKQGVTVVLQGRRNP